MNDAAELARCRDRLAAISPGQWTRVHDADGCFVEARGEMGELLPVARFHAGASEAEIEFVAEAPFMVRFLLGLVDRAIDFASRAASEASPPGAPAGRAEVPDGRAPLPPSAVGDGAAEASTEARRPSGAPPEPQAAPAAGARREAQQFSHQPDYTTECAMRCAEPAFKRFLMERHGLDSPATDARAAQKVRSLLGVTSRREINAGGRAADAWKALRGEFEHWKRAGR